MNTQPCQPKEYTVWITNSYWTMPNSTKAKRKTPLSVSIPRGPRKSDKSNTTDSVPFFIPRSERKRKDGMFIPWGHPYTPVKHSERVSRALKMADEDDSDFDRVKVSTKTFVVTTNLDINLEELFNCLDVTEINPPPNSTGSPGTWSIDLPDGSIIAVPYKDRIKGKNLNVNVSNSQKLSKNFFRNSITIVMVIDRKIINFKVSCNGRLQVTGCKNDDNIEVVTKCLFKLIQPFKGKVWRIQDTGDEWMTAIITPAMRNVDFELGFNVDREKLDDYVNCNTNYHSLLETSFGYTGVNIKIPSTEDLEQIPLHRIQYNPNNPVKQESHLYDRYDCIGTYDEWAYIPPIRYGEYVQQLPIKKYPKPKFNTFLVFHSGKVIMSGMNQQFMKGAYYIFREIINECTYLIKECLSVEDELVRSTEENRRRSVNF